MCVYVCIEPAASYLAYIQISSTRELQYYLYADYHLQSLSLRSRKVGEGIREKRQKRVELKELDTKTTLSKNSSNTKLT